MSSIACGEIPKRAAWSRLIVTASNGALYKRSLATSAKTTAMCASSFKSICWTTRSIPRYSRPVACIELAARQIRPPTVMSCAGCKKMVHAWFGELRPQAVDYLRRRDIALLARFEHDGEIPGVRGLARCAVDPDRRSESTRSQGRFKSTSPSSWCSRINCCGEVSCAPSDMPLIRPMSWIGKNPLGIVTIM